MARGKCPPGVFCVENITLALLVIFMLLIVFVIYNFLNKNNISLGKNKNVEVESQSYVHTQQAVVSPFYTNPNAVMSSRQNDILLNPYAPPLKDNRFIPEVMVVGGGGFGGDVRGGIPINVKTQGYDADYRQVGILTRNDGRETIIPLFGKPLYSNRNKWQYYTTTDGNNMIKLPVSKNGRSCTEEYGCDEVFNGDSLYVEGYKDAFNATVYENNQPRYIPYI